MSTLSAPAKPAAPAAAAGKARVFEADWSKLEKKLAWKVAELEVLNPEVGKSLLPYSWQDHDNRRAAEFRERHKLAELVAGAADDWEAILRLRHWAFTHVRNAGPSHGSMDPFDIVDTSRAGGGFWCTYFAYAFVGAASAMGYPARHLGIDCEHEKGESSTHHGVADVWVNKFRKWVALDAHHDSHHELDGIPLHAEELGLAWRKNKAAGVITRYGPQNRIVARARNVRADRHEAWTYYWCYIDSFNDVFQRRGEQWPQPVVFLVDAERKQRVWYQGKSPDTSPHKRYANQTFLATERYHDAYPDLNCTRLLFQGVTPSPYAMPMGFGTTCIPNFSHYAARVDGLPPVRVEGVEYCWQLHPGRCELDVRAVNYAGVEGPPSRIVVQVQEDKNAKPEWPGPTT